MKVLVVLSLLASLVALASGKSVHHHRHHPRRDGTWTVNNFQQSIMMSVAYGDASTAFIAGGQNGEGSNTLKSTDGGNTWNEVQIGTNTFMAMAVAAQSPTSAVISGLSIAQGAAQFTTDGNVFKKSNESGVLLETSQYASTIEGTDGLGYAIVGGFGQAGRANPANGVAFSYDGGATFDVSDCGNQEQARYGAFPSPNLWLITLGDWPNTTTNAVFPEQTMELTHNIVIHSTHRKSRIELIKPSTKRSNDGWYAGIMKSVDQGQTWQQTFENTTFYFNEISCADESTCYATGNDDTYMYVYKSTDGGDSWAQIYEQGSGANGNAILALSDSEVWVGGGVIGQLGVTGYLYHSVDGGNTWTIDTVDNNMVFGLAFAGPNQGVGVTINSMQQSGIINYKA